MRLITAIRKSEQAAACLRINEGKWVYVVRWQREYQGSWYTTEIHQYRKTRRTLSIINYEPVKRLDLKLRLGQYDESELWESYE